MNNSNNNVCIITGGGSGIGRSTAVLFAKLGATAIIVDVDDSAGQETVRMANECGGSSVFFHADISQEQDVSRLKDEVIARYSCINTLVNNAAIMRFSKVVDLSVEDWDAVMAVNIRGTFLMCKHFIPLIKKGSIINVSSVHSRSTAANVSAYAASKGAVESFSRALSIECEAIDVRVNCVIPGSVDTKMLWDNPNLKSGDEVVSGKIASPEDIAEIIYFISSDKAKAVTGSSIVVDNGLLSRLG
ncbi:MAG TPA: SDR family oxidoreductase [Solidesulfovibrio magneticus]|nr:SDR family oxidoreductase [Solidesulfovibrio magneticus]